MKDISDVVMKKNFETVNLIYKKNDKMSIEIISEPNIYEIMERLG